MYAGTPHHIPSALKRYIAVAPPCSVYYIFTMPLISQSSYRPPFFLRNPHLQSILPNALRKVKGVTYTRKRIPTPDSDFIDLDWSCIGSTKVAVIVHGLEGHSRRPYVLGMVQACNRAGWDAVAVNMRGCSGEPNLLARSYHNGSSDDFAHIIAHIATLHYESIRLAGFSLGGNVILKYLGERLHNYPETLTAAVAISTPCHLASCAEKLARKENRFYMKRFLKMLHHKISAKKHRFPTLLNDDNFHAITNFKQFDNRYTAPLHGFTSAEDYYTKASSLLFIQSIFLPTLILSAADDPFLTPQCYPTAVAEGHGNVTLEITRYGGHCGFITCSRSGNYWHEERAISFLRDTLA